MKKLASLLILAGLLIPSVSNAAISYVTSGNSFAGEFGTTGTSLTYAVTTSGTNRMLVIFVTITDTITDSITGVTYAGVPATRIKAASGDGGGAAKKFVALYYLPNPTTGTNNVVITSSASVRLSSVAVQYAGVDTTLAPNASSSYTNNTSNPLTGSLTTTVDKAWAVIGAGASGGSLTAGSGTTNRGQTGGTIFGDSNSAITPAGSKSMSINNGAALSAGVVMAAFAPAAEVTNSRKMRGTGISR